MQEGRKCARLLTRLGARKTLGGGAPELCDLCLLHDGSEREGILSRSLRGPQGQLDAAMAEVGLKTASAVETASAGQSSDAVGEYIRGWGSGWGSG